MLTFFIFLLIAALVPQTTAATFAEISRPARRDEPRAATAARTSAVLLTLSAWGRLLVYD